jgi:DNA-binding NarL/FixJ family response regulator
VLRLALVDGDPAIRAGRRLMIEAQENLHLVYEESDAEVALARIPELLIDVLVIDHRLKGFNGLELASALVEAYSKKHELCPTIIMTGTYTTPELVMASIRCGASDVVTQDAPMSELLRAINNAKSTMTLPDFTSFDEVLNHADYVPKPDPIFLLRRSQLDDEQKIFLEELDSQKTMEQVRIEMGVTQSAFQEKLNLLLVALHLATAEQLYLALHDSKAV